MAAPAPEKQPTVPKPEPITRVCICSRCRVVAKEVQKKFVDCDTCAICDSTIMNGEAYLSTSEDKHYCGFKLREHDALGNCPPKKPEEKA